MSSFCFLHCNLTRHFHKPKMESKSTMAAASFARGHLPFSLEEVEALLTVLDHPITSSPAPTSHTMEVNSSTSHRDQGAHRKVKAGRRRRHTTPTRDQQLQELRELRVSYVELSTKLDRLRASLSSGSMCDKRLAKWRHVARRQLALRRRAERENAQLQRELAVQREFACSIQIKTACCEALSSDSGKVNLYHLEAQDRAVLDMLAAELDGAYGLVGLALPHDANTVIDSRRLLGSVCAVGSTPASVDFQDERLIPFEFERVVDAMWRSWVDWHVGGSSSVSGACSASCAHPTDRPADTFAVKFRLRARSTGEHLDETLVVRRYLEAHRLVLVWRGTSSGVGGAWTDETGWIAVERASSDKESGSGSDRSLIRSFVRMIPRCDGLSSGGADDKAAQFASLVVDTYQDDVAFIHREMESLLLRDVQIDDRHLETT